jgi:RNA polymerase sigma-70 factor (ECF subfamily)
VYAPTSDSRELLRLSREGNGDAFGQLLEKYRNYLRLLARVQIGRRLQAKADPSDAVQETFIQAHRAFSDFRGVTEAEFLRWLRRVLASRLSKLVRSYLGTRRRDIALERQLHVDLDGSSQALDRALVLGHTSPSQRAARGELAASLADAIERLSPDHREVIVLRHFEELSFPEISQRMGRSVGAAEKLWMRALAKLRRAFGGTK